ncbi:hypothetical protein K456DRAFT_49983 [Colletotrichum gloeosporioides 23]|nr:hypothetical protein K456DRAFT_49983 [Colletotrichum gloeosporioides 23]
MWPVLPVCSFPTNNTLQCPVPVPVPVPSAGHIVVVVVVLVLVLALRSSLFKLHRPPRPLVHSATL